MAIKAIVGALTEAPEALRGEYRPGTKEEGLEGKFVLAVEAEGGWALENIGGLKQALSTERDRADKAESAAKAFEGLDAGDVGKKLAKLAELEKIDPAKEADKLVDAKLKAALEQVNGSHAAEIKAREDRIAALQTGLKSRTLASAVDSALAKADALNPEALRLKVQSSIRIKETGNEEDPFAIEILTPSGTPAVDNQGRPLGIDAYLSDLRKDPAWAVNFKPLGKQGAGAEGGGAGGGKTMSRQAFEQLSPADRAATMKAGTQLVD